MRTRDEIKREREMVLTKAAENGIASLCESELQRVFADTVSPAGCIRSMYAMIRVGLTLDDVYAIRPPMRDVDEYFASRDVPDRCYVVFRVRKDGSDRVVMEVVANSAQMAIHGIRATIDSLVDANLYAVPCAQFRVESNLPRSEDGAPNASDDAGQTVNVSQNAGGSR